MKAVGIDVGKAALDVAVRGDRRLRKELVGGGDVRIVVEATGGYEEALLDACTQEIDALDAHVLAEMAHALYGRMRPHVPQAAWQVELRGWLRRPRRVVYRAFAQQTTRTAKAVRRAPFGHLTHSSHINA